jgi:hypothetical protein
LLNVKLVVHIVTTGLDIYRPLGFKGVNIDGGNFSISEDKTHARTT